MVVTLRNVLTVLVDPVRSLRETQRRDHRWVVWMAVWGGAALLGAATLPRQLQLLYEALAPVEDPIVAMHHEVLRRGLTRLIIVDRLFPWPALLLAGGILGLVATTALGLANDMRSRVWAIIGMGLAPILVGRIGELAMTYLLELPAVSPGEAIGLPHRFSMGPRLLWWSESSAPSWLELLDARANLVVLWVAVLWAVGLKTVDDAARVEPWHFALPLFCIAVAGVLTWAGGPLVVGAVLGMG